MRCSSCSSQIPDSSRFCSSCGAVVEIGTTPTLMDDAPAPRTPPSSRSTPSSKPSSSGLHQDARFVPGVILEDRYRIVSLTGKGGMGEVYRADDLKLEQTVALKFLPQALVLDGAALARFHREVRTARQISHPNVCRVFDIGEADGVPFLTMEYVDGEDLASLLRRIGRLPPDKATEIARQICAGLAAAHEFGVIHRDLKPSNVMLDGRGKARVTDFGLAAAAGEFRPEESRAGTPAYMAPEQLAGKEATVRSDVYALGLVLYEVFTGKRAFDAASLADLAKLHEQTTPTSPSALIKDLDPIIERVILRCLEKDPAKRPASALQVAAALPGGDPLAAALAAGETPSPEMVAASGETEGLRPGVAWSCLAGVVVCTLLAVVLSAYTKLYRFVPMDKPPEALAEKARDILQGVGYTNSPADTAVGFTQNVEFLRYIAKSDKSKTRWNNLETGAIGFWYRSSPRPLEALSFFPPTGPPGTVAPDDPPLLQSGMTLLRLNPRGRLISLVVVPPQVEKDAAATPLAADWAPLFAAAGLDPAKWTSTQSTWTPPVYSDARAAWTGALAERLGVPMRIEAAAYRGKPVYFEMIGPWMRPERMQPYQPTTGERIAQIIGLVLLLTLLVGGVLLARRNIRKGRGDRKGAARLAGLALALLAVNWLFGTHHVPNFYELGIFVMWLGGTLCFAGLLWMLYVALEPYVRRRWPATLVSWTRLLSGGWRDPLVGRDILAGSLVGTFGIVVARTILVAPTWFGQIPLQPYAGPDWQFLGGRIVVSDVAGGVSSAVATSLVYLFVLFVLRLLLRKDWLAGVALVAVLTALAAFQSDTPVVTAFAQIITNTVIVFLLIRFGLLAMIAAQFLGVVIGSYPLTTELSAWYISISFAGLLLIGAVAFYGFYFSLGGRPAFGSAALEE
jgi:hypothetical protein